VYTKQLSWNVMYWQNVETDEILYLLPPSVSALSTGIIYVTNINGFCLTGLLFQSCCKLCQKQT